MSSRVPLCVDLPARAGQAEPRILVGITEFSTCIPYLFEVACSRDPRPVFPGPEGRWRNENGELDLTIEADFELGKAELLRFLRMLQERLGRVVVVPPGLDLAQVSAQIAQVRQLLASPQLAGCTRFALNGIEVFGLELEEADDEGFIDLAEEELEVARDMWKHNVRRLEDLLPDWSLGLAPAPGPDAVNRWGESLLDLPRQKWDLLGLDALAQARV